MPAARFAWPSALWRLDRRLRYWLLFDTSGRDDPDQYALAVAELAPKGHSGDRAISKVDEGVLSADQPGGVPAKVRFMADKSHSLPARIADTPC